jgi:hypothetical protein
MGAKRNAYGVLVGKPEGNGPLGRPKYRWMDNIKMYLSEVGWGGIYWIDVAQSRDQCRALMNTVMNLRVSYYIGKFLSSCTNGGFSRRAQLYSKKKVKLSLCLTN